MIPDESTPIKNMILTEIIAQGRLSYDEVRIASFVMRWSWGFDAGDRRQDWTKEFTVSEIARAINMKQSLCWRTINRMVNDGKLLRDGNKFQFNEHYKNWKVSQKVITQPITSNYNSYNRKLYPLLQKVITPITNSYNPDAQETLIAKELEGKNALRKETIKETKDKETIKIIAHDEKNEKILLKDERQEKAKELLKEFCKLRNIPLDSGFFSKNIRSARALASTYPVEFILAGVEWRLANDDDGFWTQKLFNLNTVYSHFAEWIAQSNLKSVSTFADWLSRHPEENYKEITEPEAKIKAFFVAFNRAIKNGATPTIEEWQKYQTVRNLQKQSIGG